MKKFTSRPAIALAAAAALAMTATPAMARGWHRHHDRGLDAGDVFAGLLIIGGIAAVASAASKANRDKREREYRYPDRRYPEQSRYPSDEDYRNYRDYRDRSGGYAEPQSDERYSGTGDWSGGGTVGAAVDACVSEAERGSRRVGTVDSVNRQDNGWRVDGRVEGGGDFTCEVGSDLRIRRFAIDGRAVI